MTDLESLSDQELCALIKEREENPSFYWIPNGAQENFIKMCGGVKCGTPQLHKQNGFYHNDLTWIQSDDYNFINVFVGANGTGKTALEVIMNGVRLGACDNPFFKDSSGELLYSYRDRIAGGRIWLISNSANIKDTIVPAIFEYWKKGTYTADKAGKEYYSKFTTSRGILEMKTYEQAVTEFRGATLWVAQFDEPEDTPEIFKEVSARFRRGGQIEFFLTPLGSAAWVHDLVLGNTNWNVGAVYADLEVNCIQHGINGMLEHEHIERMIAGWDESEREARAHAKWMHLKGVVYPMFDRKVHVIDPREVPKEGTIFCTLDPHSRRPPFMGWFKACPDGRLYMIKEHPEVSYTSLGRGSDKKILRYYEDIDFDTGTIDDHCDIIKSIEEEIGVADKRKMDGRLGADTYRNTGKKVFQEYGARGVYFELAGVDATLARKHTKVKALLRHSNIDGADKTKPVILPRFYITSNCLNTIRAFERYQYDNDYKGALEKVKEEYKDEMDVVGMAIDSEFKYTDPAFKQKWDQMLASIPKNNLRESCRTN